MAERLFKVRMRRGRALLGMTNDDSTAPRADSEEEVVVSEHAAAFPVRNRAAAVIEVLESSEDRRETS